MEITKTDRQKHDKSVKIPQTLIALLFNACIFEWGYSLRYKISQIVMMPQTSYCAISLLWSIKKAIWETVIEAYQTVR